MLRTLGFIVEDARQRYWDALAEDLRDLQPEDRLPTGKGEGLATSMLRLPARRRGLVKVPQENQPALPEPPSPCFVVGGVKGEASRPRRPVAVHCWGQGPEQAVSPRLSEISWGTTPRHEEDPQSD